MDREASKEIVRFKLGGNPSEKEFEDLWWYSPLGEAARSQLLGFPGTLKPNIQKKICEAIDEQQDWIIDLIFELSNYGWGSRKIAQIFHVGRNTIKKILKS